MTQQPPPHFLPPQQKKKGRKWPWVLVAVVILFIWIGANGSKNSNTTNNASVATPSTSAAPAAPVSGIGQEVRDGKFGFIVSDIQHSPTAGGETARGEFVIVTMTVKNTGDQPQSFFAQNQKLFDTSGRQYAADSMATSDSMVMDLNPGFTLPVKVAFDVPPGTAISALEVHDSAFSGGAKINLP
jgi:hypothetical protein